MPDRQTYTPVPPIISDSVFTSDNAYLCKHKLGHESCRHFRPIPSFPPLHQALYSPNPLKRGGIAHPPPFERILAILTRAAVPSQPSLSKLLCEDQEIRK